jgi:signal transduction histidine kinase/CHASE1-domain containing sensor protein
VQNSFETYLSALSFFGDFFNNSEQVTRKEFADFAKTAISRYPGIQAFSYNPLVSHQQRAQFEQQAQQTGFKDFTFTQTNPQGQLIPAHPTNEYIVVYFVEPLEGNESALGYTISSDPSRLAAATQAFNSGKLSATGRITLVQEKDNQYGVLILLPIYHKSDTPDTAGLNPQPSPQLSPQLSPQARHKQRKGFVVQVLRVASVIETALNSLPDMGIDIYLYDDTATKDQQLLYFRPAGGQSAKVSVPVRSDVQSGLYYLNSFDIAGRQWSLVFTPSPLYQNSFSSLHKLIVFFVGLLLTCLLSIYLCSKAKYTRQIEHSNHKLQQEITQHQQTEKQLLTSNDYLDTILHNLPIGVGILEGPQLRYLRINQALADLNGLPIDAHLGKTVAEVLPHASHSLIPELLKVMETGQPILHRESTHRHPITPNHPLHIVDWHLPISGQDNQSKAIICVVMDVTELKEAQAQLVQTSKLEALGTLAGGIAHDFNNILAAILGNSEMVKIALAEDHKARANLNNIISSTGRATSLVRQILTFSQMKAFNLAPTDLAEVVKQALKMAALTIPTTIKINQQLQANCPPIMADENQIQQVILNLCSNASHAMEISGGQLTVTLKEITLRDSKLGLKAGHYLQLAITDTGHGITHAHQEWIFDPFFTNKEVGKGTGLGLSVVHGIVTKHNGTITVQSEESHGSTFTVYFTVITAVSTAKDECAE